MGKRWGDSKGGVVAIHYDAEEFELAEMSNDRMRAYSLAKRFCDGPFTIASEVVEGTPPGDFGNYQDSISSFTLFMRHQDLYIAFKCEKPGASLYSGQ